MGLQLLAGFLDVGAGLGLGLGDAFVVRGAVVVGDGFTGVLRTAGVEVGADVRIVTAAAGELVGSTAKAAAAVRSEPVVVFVPSSTRPSTPLIPRQRAQTAATPPTTMAAILFRDGPFTTAMGEVRYGAGGWTIAASGINEGRP
ncbi:hypothetical protein GCM10009681_48880 [Luedemannella helvata]|uniref:Uncharacterized protein n=1 Tax=Luedemannella helvata TaxID=349315 RepID=A0ABP4XAD5_9ACTN